LLDFIALQHVAPQIHHEIWNKARIKAALPMPCPDAGRWDPLPSLDQAYGLWTTSRWLSWQYWKHKKSCTYI